MCPGHSEMCNFVLKSYGLSCLNVINIEEASEHRLA